MISLSRKLNIEFNNFSYVIKLSSTKNNLFLNMGEMNTLFISSINNNKVSPELFFNQLKHLTSHSIFSLYSEGRRYVAEHINAHLHLNMGNHYARRDKSIFLIEWQINIILEL